VHQIVAKAGNFQELIARADENKSRLKKRVPGPAQYATLHQRPGTVAPDVARVVSTVRRCVPRCIPDAGVRALALDQHRYRDGAIGGRMPPAPPAGPGVTAGRGGSYGLKSAASAS
jgi:hypothetical protein